MCVAPETPPNPKKIETATQRAFRIRMEALEERENKKNEECEKCVEEVEEAVEGIVKTAIDSKRFPNPKRSG